MMKILNDSEHRIFLSAMSRERKVCENEDFYDYDGTNKLLDICDSIERKINDAELVRHGHWVAYEDNKRECYCSNCEFPAGLDAYGYHNMQDPYCRFCGAKMNMEDNDETD